MNQKVHVMFEHKQAQACRSMDDFVCVLEPAHIAWGGKVSLFEVVLSGVMPNRQDCSVRPIFIPTE